LPQQLGEHSRDASLMLRRQRGTEGQALGDKDGVFRFALFQAHPELFELPT
jgi:hypothetical protein